MTSSDFGSFRIFSGVAIRSEMLELIQSFPNLNSMKIETAFDLNPAVAKRMMSGELFDVGLTNPWHVTELIAKGIVIADTHTAFGRVPLAIGSRDRRSAILESVEDIRAMLLEATSIAYTGEGTSGASFRKACKRLNLGESFLQRAKPLAAGEPVHAAAEGVVELAIAPLTSIIAASGIEPAATFPRELEVSIDMSAFVSCDTIHQALAKRFVAFLADCSNDTFLATRGIVRFEMDDAFKNAGEYFTRPRPY